MDYRKTQGIVIRVMDYRESSQIVTLYTHDYGKITLMARGIRRHRNDLDGPFDLLTYCEIVYISNPLKQMNILTGSKIYDNFSALRNAYGKHLYGWMVAEMLNEITPAEDSNRALFSLAKATLSNMCKTRPGLKGKDETLRLLFFNFQVHALKHLGYLSAKNLKVTSFPQGIISRNDSRGVFALVENLLKAKTPLERLRLSQEMLGKLYGFLDKYISCITGRQLKVRMYDENKVMVAAALCNNRTGNI
jgi:hypothetical protein